MIVEEVCLRISQLPREFLERFVNGCTSYELENMVSWCKEDGKNDSMMRVEIRIGKGNDEFFFKKNMPYDIVEAEANRRLRGMERDKCTLEQIIKNIKWEKDNGENKKN